METKMLKKSVMAIMMAGVALILIIASLILPWWGQNLKTSSDDSKSEYGIGVPLMGTIGSYSTSTTTIYSGSYSVPMLFGITALLLVCASIGLLLFILSIIILMIIKNKGTKLPTIFGIIALICCILAPLIFMALPNAIKADEEKRADMSNTDYEAPDHDDPSKSFFGTYIDDDESNYYKTTTTWGGDIGWVLSFISFGMILGSFMITVRNKRSVSEPTAPVDRPYLAYQPIEQEPPSYPRPQPPEYRPPGYQQAQQYPQQPHQPTSNYPPPPSIPDNAPEEYPPSW